MNAARDLRKSAAGNEASGRLGRAYGELLEAWKLARAHPEAPGASALAGALQADLDRLRDALNDAASTPLSDRTIRVK